jgi:hypothetical protein
MATEGLLSGALLPTLSTKLVEMIMGNLDLPSIGNLRRTCKSLEKKSLSLWMKRYIRHQKTDLSQESLDRLKELASHSKLGPAVQILTIVATVYDTSEVEEMLKSKKKTIRSRTGPFFVTEKPQCTEDELEAARDDLKWLQDKQRELEALGSEAVVNSLVNAFKSFRVLEAIELDAVVMLGKGKTVSTAISPEWHPIWMGAARTYDTALLAIARSKVRTEFLTIYRATPRCSVTSWDVTAHLDKLEAEGFAESGICIKNFALSFSTRVPMNFAFIEDARNRLEGAAKAYHESFGSTAGLYEDANAEFRAEENFTGIPRLLKNMPHLEALDLHMRNASRSVAGNYDQIFIAIANDVQFIHLQQVFLRGIVATENSLLQFLRKHPMLTDATFCEVHLTSGAWNLVFEQLCRMPNLKRLYLSNLWGPQLVNLEPIDGFEDAEDSYRLWWFPCFGGKLVHTNEFGREELDKGLKFKPRPKGRQLGSAQFAHWRQSRESLYGPP